MKRIRVKLKENSYDVLIGRGWLRRAGRELRRRLPSSTSQIMVVTSPTIRHHWGNRLEESLQREKLRYRVLEMSDGEPAKRLQTVEQLAEQMVVSGADRSALLVAFGGGVVGDCAGFLASIFMRGIPVVQIPTTVLAQVDASIGGKTGVNLRSGKNLIGTFHQPKCVLVDPEILETLEEREFRAGLFESLKCGVIRDRKLFAFMERQEKKISARDSTAVERIILDSVRVKASVVSADERESGLRRILNFGHTVGHALEAATNYDQILHGEAVAWGMLAGASIAQEIRMCDKETAERIRAAVQAYGPLPSIRAQAHDVISRLKSDKKTIAGDIHWVLPQKIGKVKIVTGVDSTVVERAVKEICNC